MDRQLVLAVDRRRTGAPPVDEVMDMQILVQIIKLRSTSCTLSAAARGKFNFSRAESSPSWTL